MASDAAENALLKLIFQAIAWSGIALPDGVTTLYVSLHTADPTDAGDQTSSEATYTNYARVGVARSSSGWAVSGDQASNVAEVLFPTCGAMGSPQSLTHFGVGTAATGAGQLVGSGAAPSALAVSQNIAPRFAPGALVATAT